MQNTYLRTDSFLAALLTKPLQACVADKGLNRFPAIPALHRGVAPRHKHSQTGRVGPANVKRLDLVEDLPRFS